VPGDVGTGPGTVGRVTSQHMTSTAADPADYRLACDDLLALWRAMPRRATTNTADELLARVVVGLGIHVVSATTGAFLMTAQGFNRDTLPLARKCLEFAVFAQWLRINGKPALDGFLAHSNKRSKQLVESMTVAGVTVPADVVESFKDAEPPAEPGAPKRRPAPEVEVAGNFSRICESVRQGDFLYFLYRGLSADCHPSVTAISMMLPGREAEAEEMGRTSRTTDYVCALSLLLAFGAADDVALGEQQRPELEKIAAPLGLLTRLTAR
jgi:Family of unknown function (DUF5677)